jgi:hypothetical protein
MLFLKWTSESPHNIFLSLAGNVYAHVRPGTLRSMCHDGSAAAIMRSHAIFRPENGEMQIAVRHAPNASPAKKPDASVPNQSWACI